METIAVLQAPSVARVKATATLTQIALGTWSVEKTTVALLPTLIWMMTAVKNDVSALVVFI